MQDWLEVTLLVVYGQSQLVGLHALQLNKILPNKIAKASMQTCGRLLVLALHAPMRDVSFLRYHSYLKRIRHRPLEPRM